jgi:hypothetical protein
MFRLGKPAADESWDAKVLAKSRRMPDGSFLYRYVEIELKDGGTRKIRVDKGLYDSLKVGDRINKQAGAAPTKG